MKVLHIIPVYAPAWRYGGPVVSVSRLCEGLVECGVDVEVMTTTAGLCIDEDKSQPREVIRNGVKVTYYPETWFGGYIYSRSLVRDLPRKIKDVDVLHLSSVWQPLGARVRMHATTANVPIVQSTRGALSRYSFSKSRFKKLFYYWLLEKANLKKSNILHVTSSQEQVEVERLGLGVKTWLLPNPIDIHDKGNLDTTREEARRRLNVRERCPVFLICGRMHHKKGLDLLPDVLNELRSEDWRLIIAGADEDGSGKRVIDEMIKLGLKERLIRLGQVSGDQIAEIYAAADMLLLPSRHENFGNVVIEALLYGCSVCVSNATGAAGDLMGGAPLGYGYVLKREKGVWIETLKGWLKNPDRAGESCSRWVQLKYDTRVIAKQAKLRYQELWMAD